MASNKLKVQEFRANDLANDTGKQFELGKTWCDFFEIDSSVGEISFTLTFKPLSEQHFPFTNKQIELKLSELTGRNDRKAYANGNNGFSQIKDFFLNDLKLTLNNVNDYFAIYKASELDYYLYYIPQMLHDNFIKLFETVIPVVSTHKNGSNKININLANLQRIYYGAPGTGKSYEIKRLTQDKEIIRTTFHPDSDYSTFVGAYKPTTIEVPVRDVTGKIIIENREQVTENRIVYEFVEQAFLQAYIKAWKAYTQIAAGEQPVEQYLVIEEINRGNCAQIFGDLFQLLDRNHDGFSEYPVTADKDMKKQLAKTFKNLEIADAERINKYYNEDMVSKVLSGEVLLLPDNLYIWATMNTSDQSLFPIDSAFKRRWEWKYIPISEGKTETGEKLDYKIQIKDKKYDWWTFLNKINDEIEETTKSEDKKLGYFFCKANDGIIDADTFVSKVVFYLWNDVFKDQDVSIFSDEEGEMTFSKFYDTDKTGKTIVKDNKVELLMQNLKVEPLQNSIIDSIETDDGDDETDDGDDETERNNKDSSTYSINGEGRYIKKRVPYQSVALYVKEHPEYSSQEIVNTWTSVIGKLSVITSEDYQRKSQNTSDDRFDKRYYPVSLSNGETIYVYNQYTLDRIKEFISKVNSYTWNIHIERIIE